MLKLHLVFKICKQSNKALTNYEGFNLVVSGTARATQCEESFHLLVWLMGRSLFCICNNETLHFNILLLAQQDLSLLLTPSPPVQPGFSLSLCYTNFVSSRLCSRADLESLLTLCLSDQRPQISSFFSLYFLYLSALRCCSFLFQNSNWSFIIMLKVFLRLKSIFFVERFFFLWAILQPKRHKDLHCPSLQDLGDTISQCLSERLP